MGLTFEIADRPMFGRLARPPMTPATDPRIRPALREALAKFGLDGFQEPPLVDRHGPLERVLEAVRLQHDNFEGFLDALMDGRSVERDDVEETSAFVSGEDGHQIEVRIYRPRDVTGPLDAVIYMHGGGMAILNTFNKVHTRWLVDMASAGLVSVNIDFRNSYTPQGLNPFPTGLQDCATAVQWVHENRSGLGISRLALHGDSGGGNLVLATALKAQREAWVEMIDGVYASVPYTSGATAWPLERRLRELPSLVELDGYTITTAGTDLQTFIYDPTGEHAENPLAWPYYAQAKDLEGLPPHRIVVEELDPLRDDGIAYFHKLQQAGISVTGRVNLGLVHAAEMVFHEALADDYALRLADVKQFTQTL